MRWLTLTVMTGAAALATEAIGRAVLTTAACCLQGADPGVLHLSPLKAELTAVVG